MNGAPPKDNNFTNLSIRQNITTPMIRAADVVVENSLMLANGATITSEPNSSVIGAETINVGTLNATTINVGPPSIIP
jgi:hypothetical protein